MGTNYEAHYKVCKECGKPGLEVHIGKSSAGWKFIFQAYPPKHWRWEKGDFPKTVITEIDDWKEVISDPLIEIVDEYGKTMPKKEFWDLVEGKQSGKGHICGDPDVYTDDYGYDFSAREFS